MAFAEKCVVMVMVGQWLGVGFLLSVLLGITISEKLRK